ncbi:MAG: NADH:flavin oxidoreductase [Desulfomonilaceae bacterium]
MYEKLFEPFQIDSLQLKNRLTMTPLYLGYAGEGGSVSAPLLEHYRLMAQSGVALIVVENATIDYQRGSGSHHTLRVDTDDAIEGLQRLAETIKKEGSLACLQINHAGRFASAPNPVAPSAVDTFGRMPSALTKKEIMETQNNFANAALRVKKAGFDMVELHGGTGYLLSEFLSPRTNQRPDEYGGSFENRQRFALEVLSKVKDAVSPFPVGYRFLADEWLPGGLKIEESALFARSLASQGIAYLSVMGGTYESFFLPEIKEKSTKPGYMVDLAAAIKKEVDVPVIAAGLVNSGHLAERIIVEGKADLIGLARVLWTDPEWPQKVIQGRENEILQCDSCYACMKLVMKGKPAFCVRWPLDKQKFWKSKFE